MPYPIWYNMSESHCIQINKYNVIYAIVYVYIYDLQTTYYKMKKVMKRREKNDTNNIILYIIYQRKNHFSHYYIYIFINKIIKFEKVGIEIWKNYGSQYVYYKV